jgi:RNA polymerase sigma factor (sigma-70 family)
MSKNRYGGVDSYAAFFISIKAKTMIRTGLFTPDDREDIEQELMMAYLKDEGNFKGDRAEKETFTRMVINHRSIQMIREITADKRKVRLKEISLDQPVFDDEETLFIDQLDDTGALWGEKPFESFADLSIQRIDILKIRDSLPADLQQTFDLVMEHSISEAAEILKIPRTTFSSRVKKLKEYLMQSQFKNYF